MGSSWEHNRVRLRGRVSGAPQERTLPSGDRLVAFRVVVPRGAGLRPRVPGQDAAEPERRQPTIDTIDCSAWTAVTREAVRQLDDGDTVEVTGALRRRFRRTGGALTSRCDVEVKQVRLLPASASAGGGRTGPRGSSAGKRPAEATATPGRTRAEADSPADHAD